MGHPGLQWCHPGCLLSQTITPEKDCLNSGFWRVLVRDAHSLDQGAWAGRGVRALCDITKAWYAHLDQAKDDKGKPCSTGWRHSIGSFNFHATHFSPVWFSFTSLLQSSEKRAANSFGRGGAPSALRRSDHSGKRRRHFILSVRHGWLQMRRSSKCVCVCVCLNLSSRLLQYLFYVASAGSSVDPSLFNGCVYKFPLLTIQHHYLHLIQILQGFFTKKKKKMSRSSTSDALT